MRTFLASVLVLALANVADAQSYSRSDRPFGRGRITVLEPLLPTPSVVPASALAAQVEPDVQPGLPVPRSVPPEGAPNPVPRPRMPQIGGGAPIADSDTEPPVRVSLTLLNICHGGKVFTDQAGRTWILKYVTVPTNAPLRNPPALDGWLIPIAYGRLFVTDGGRIYQPYIH